MKIYRYTRRQEGHGGPYPIDNLEFKIDVIRDACSRTTTLRYGDQCYQITDDVHSSMPLDIHGLDWKTFAETMCIPQWAAKFFYAREAIARDRLTPVRVTGRRLEVYCDSGWDD